MLIVQGVKGIQYKVNTFVSSQFFPDRTGLQEFKVSAKKSNDFTRNIVSIITTNLLSKGSVAQVIRAVG